MQYRCQQQKYKLKDTQYAKNSHLPGCGQILKVSTSWVNGEGVNGGRVPSGYKEGKATLGFHKPRATPMEKGRPWL